FPLAGLQLGYPEGGGALLLPLVQADPAAGVEQDAAVLDSDDGPGLVRAGGEDAVFLVVRHDRCTVLEDPLQGVAGGKDHGAALPGVGDAEPAVVAPDPGTIGGDLELGWMAAHHAGVAEPYEQAGREGSDGNGFCR